MTEVDVSESDVSSYKMTEREIASSNTNVSEDGASDLIHGSSSQAGNREPISDRTNDPIWYVERFRAHREQSVREVVNSTIAVCEGLDAIGNDKTEFRRFVAALADAKVMSQAEAKKQKRADMSTLSKIQKIYEHRDIILHQSVADKLCTGYSVLYELALLIDQLIPEVDDVADKVADVSSRLSQHLETLDGDLTRRWIKGVRESVGPIPSREKKDKSDRPVEQNGIPSNTNYDSEMPTNNSQLEDEDSEETLGGTDENISYQNVDEAEIDITSDDEASVPAKGQQLDVTAADHDSPITAVLLIVDGPADDEALAEYAQSEEWKTEVAQMADDAVVLVFAPLRFLLEISQAIKTFNYWRCNGVHLLSQPPDLDVSECDVLAIYERGLGASIPGLAHWTAGSTPNVIAEQLVTGLSGRFVQFFGETAVPGWESLASARE